jgi:uncharacterized protein (DUF1330 family)
MSAYIIAFVNVTDRKRYSEYMKVTPGVIAKFGGRFIARGGRMMTLEGMEETRRVVLIEFPTFERAEAFYHSDEYGNTKKMRIGAATATFLLAEGCLPPQEAR